MSRTLPLAVVPGVRARSGLPALVVLLALSVVAAGCGAAKKEEPRNGAAYVALGDSYTSGPGLTPIADAPCKRSEINYPSLVAKAMKIKSFSDRSCGGAATVHLLKPQMFGRGTINDPQFDALGKDTTLVSIGMGLNNQSISVGLLLVCLTPHGATPSDKCRRYLGAPESTIEAQMRGAAAQVGLSLAAIRKKAPDARIVLVGYPRLVPDQGDCPDRLPVPEAQIERMREAMKYADQVWQKTADDAGADYIDMYQASAGHDICSSDPWIAGYGGISGTGPQLHPYAAYHRAVAERIEAALETDSSGS